MFKKIIFLLGVFMLASCCATKPLPQFNDKFDPIDYKLKIKHTYALKVEKQIFNFLALSGGGPDGAWGAGVLKGWTESSQRPSFDVVTGISTGALIAPMAFLGRPQDDAALEKFYTSVDNTDIYHYKFPLFILFSNSIATTKPLLKIINETLPNSSIDLITEEGKKGRKLLVASTDLDTGKLVIWDLTKLAMSDNSEKYDRFRQLILASASVPVFFPPVKIDGDLHVDGSARDNIFLAKDVLETVANQGTVKVYVIINGKPGSLKKTISNWIFPIAKQTISVVIDAIQVSDLYRIRGICGKNKADFNLCFSTSPHTSGMNFDKKEMSALFLDGYNWGKNPNWLKELPTGLD